MTACFDALEAHRRAVTARLDGIDPALVHARPGPDAWSLAQLADHFVRVDRGLAPGARATVFETARSRAGRLVLGCVLALPLRIPAPPSAHGVMPHAAPRWPDVREAWATLRDTWRAQIGDADPVTLAYRHPLVGPLRLDDALAFLLAHARHHDAQVQRTLRALGARDAGI